MAVCDLELEGGVSAHMYLSWLHPEKTAKVTVIGRERMLSYEGRFEKRGITLYDYAVETASGENGVAPIVPITHFAAHRLEVPAAAEPLALAAEHFVESVLTGSEPLTSGARSLRVVEVLAAAEHAATRGGRAA
jgi:UDP-2-acetamido-3-amino-2,3-dideoxy-glucuronate N-acetyltransferase